MGFYASAQRAQAKWNTKRRSCNDFATKVAGSTLKFFFPHSFSTRCARVFDRFSTGYGWNSFLQTRSSHPHAISSMRFRRLSEPSTLAYRTVIRRPSALDDAADRAAAAAARARLAFAIVDAERVAVAGPCLTFDRFVQYISDCLHQFMEHWSRCAILRHHCRGPAFR